MKKVYIIIIILAVGAGILLWANSKKQSKVTGMQEKKYEVALPEGFPKDFPLDVTAKAATADATKDGNLIFKTNLLPAQAFSAYEDYLIKNKWEILLKTKNPLTSSINAKNQNGETLAIVMELGNDNKTTVKAYLTKKK